VWGVGAGAVAPPPGGAGGTARAESSATVTSPSSVSAERLAAGACRTRAPPPNQVSAACSNSAQPRVHATRRPSPRSTAICSNGSSVGLLGELGDHTGHALVHEFAHQAPQVLFVVHFAEQA